VRLGATGAETANSASSLLRIGAATARVYGRRPYRDPLSSNQGCTRDRRVRTHRMSVGSAHLVNGPHDAMSSSGCRFYALRRRAVGWAASALSARRAQKAPTWL
jgi:hypothetical protein